MKTLCVFCGSSLGFKAKHRQLAENLGKQLARRNIKLVYGGGKIGLMGVLANAVLENGGVVTGVIPEFLMKSEVAHSTLTEMIVVKDMHARKQCMYSLSRGFVVIPGGIGTLDEAIEIITWKYLQLHKKPVVMLSNDHYWEAFSSLIGQIVVEGFAPKAIEGLFTTLDDIDQALDTIK